MRSNREIYKLYLSNFLTGLVFWYAIEQLFMRSIGIDAVGMALNISLLAAFNLLFDIPSGMIADRWSRKAVLMVSALALAAASYIYGSASNLAQFLPGTLLYGLYIVTTSGTYQAMMYDVLHEQNRAHDYSKINGRAYSLFLIGVTVGNAMSGIIVHNFDYKTTFYITMVSCVINFFVMWSMREPKYHKLEHKEKMLRQIGDATLAILRKSVLLMLVSIGALLTIINVFSIDFGQLYLSRYLSDVQIIGGVWAVYAFALATGHFVAHYFRHRLYVLVLLASLPVVGMVFIDNIAAIALMFIQGVGSSALFNQIDTRIQENTPSNLRASITSVVSAFGRLVAIPGSFVIGWLIRDYSVLVALQFTSCAAVLILAVWFIGRSRLKQLSH